MPMKRVIDLPVRAIAVETDVFHAVAGTADYQMALNTLAKFIHTTSRFGRIQHVIGNESYTVPVVEACELLLIATGDVAGSIITLPDLTGRIDVDAMAVTVFNFTANLATSQLVAGSTGPVQFPAVGASVTYEAVKVSGSSSTWAIKADTGTALPYVGRVMRRDLAGRAQVADPTDPDDIANVRLQYDLIVDSNSKLAQWQACVDGSMKRVLIKSGTWNIATLSANALPTVIDLVAAGTWHVRAEKDAIINFAGNVANTNILAGMRGADAASNQYDFINVQLTVTNLSTTTNGICAGFVSVANLRDCRATMRTTNSTGFYDCYNLSNCYTNAAAYSTSVLQESHAFVGCKKLIFCKSLQSNLGSTVAICDAYLSCTEVVDCTADMTSSNVVYGINGCTNVSGSVFTIAAPDNSLMAKDSSFIAGCSCTLSSATIPVKMGTGCTNVKNNRGLNQMTLDLDDDWEIVIDSMTEMLKWQSHSYGLLRRVKIKAMTFNVTTLSTTAGFAFNLGNSGTSHILAEPGSLINVDYSYNGVLVGFGYTAAIGTIYAKFEGIDLRVTNTHASGSAHTFKNMGNLINCNGNAKAVNGSGLSAIGFNACHTLTNCQASGWSATIGLSVGFHSCSRLNRCKVNDSTMTVTGYNAVGFYSCDTMDACEAAFNNPYTNAGGMTTGYYNSARMTACFASPTNAVGTRNAFGFHTCTNMDRCVAGVTNNAIGSGSFAYYLSADIKSCVANATINPSSTATDCIGFSSCSQVHNCDTILSGAGSNQKYGFYDSRRLSFNKVTNANIKYNVSYVENSGGTTIPTGGSDTYTYMYNI